MEYFRKIKFIWGSDYSKLTVILITFLVASAIDLLGIGIIGPYIAILIDPDSFRLPFNLEKYFSNFGFFDKRINPEFYSGVIKGDN